MSTNYYLHAWECPFCGRELKNPLHIGKASSGWYFRLRIYPNLTYVRLLSLEDWKTFLEKAVAKGRNKIKNQYGEEVSVNKLLEIITKRQGNLNCTRTEKFLKENNAEIGNYNLLKYISGHNGHGDCWTFFEKNFS